MSVTQQQIADRLGVSRMSVTRAFQGHPKVSAKRREEILETAREMGYHADSNRDARAMVARRYGQQVRHRAIGYTNFWQDNGKPLPYGTQIMEGVNHVARQKGLELLLLQNVPSKGWENVDGLLLHAASNEEVAPIRELKIPLVTMMANVPGIAGVTVDDFDGAKQATDHLISLGHRRVAFLLDLHVKEEHAVQRKMGYEAGLRAAGIQPDPRWIGNLRIDDATFLQRGRDSMNEWMQRDWSTLGCTALLVQNDRAAIGVMEALQEAGVEIPKQLSVVGFDSTDECEIVKPQLTSVSMPLREVGEQATLLLFDLINESATESLHRVLPVGLDIRSSTGGLKPRH